MSHEELPRPSVIAVAEMYGARVYGQGIGWQKCNCPLPEHEDRTPSASINEELGKWVCRACDRSGDALDLIQEHESVGLVEAIERAKELLDGGVPGVSPADRRSGSSLSPRTRNRQRGGNWTPPWKVF